MGFKIDVDKNGAVRPSRPPVTPEEHAALQDFVRKRISDCEKKLISEVVEEIKDFYSR